MNRTITNLTVKSPSHFLFWLANADPEFVSRGREHEDALVLDRIRTCLYSQRRQFQDNLREIWQARCAVAIACFEDLLVLYYQPGDYAEASRFLWEKTAEVTDEEINELFDPRRES